MKNKSYKPYKTLDVEIDDITLLEPTATYSYSDYLKWTFQERVELIKGKLFNMSPAPIRLHQEISVNLLTAFSTFLKQKKCKVYHAPFDVRLPKNPKDPDNEIFSVVQPDLCIICNEDVLDTKGCNGSPDLIVEILSPSTAQKDLTDKFTLYEENGVSEYWVVYPTDQVIDIFQLNKQKEYHLKRRFEKADQIAVKTLPGLTISVKEVFE